MKKERKFSDYKSEAEAWITLATGEYYPDILPDACRLYEPVLVEFGLLLKASHSSTNFFTSIMETRNQWMRTQLCRVFKKYVSPQTPVEMLNEKQTQIKYALSLVMLSGILSKSNKNSTVAPCPTKRYAQCFGNTRIAAKKAMT